MIIPPHSSRVTLLQKAQLSISNDEYPFVQLTERLHRALGEVPQTNLMSGELRNPVLRDDYLVLDRETKGEVWQRIAVTKSGMVVSSTSIPLNWPNREDIHIKPEEVLRLLAHKVCFAWCFFWDMANLKDSVLFEWSLEGLTPNTIANTSRFGSPDPFVEMRCQAGVERTWYPQTGWTRERQIGKKAVVKTLAEVVCELFFPFEGQDETKRLCRLTMSEQDANALIADELSIFPFPKRDRSS